MVQFAQLDDGRGRFPEPVKVQTEFGTRAKIREAAQAEGITASEFVRRAIGERVAQVSARRSTVALVG